MIKTKNPELLTINQHIPAPQILMTKIHIGSKKSSMKITMVSVDFHFQTIKTNQREILPFFTSPYQNQDQIDIVVVSLT